MLVRLWEQQVLDEAYPFIFEVDDLYWRLCTEV